MEKWHTGEAIITSIEEVENVTSGLEGDSSYYDGWVIKTDSELELSILIENGQGISEQWGYAVSEDDVNKFIYAKLFSIETVDTAYNSKMLDIYKLIDQKEEGGFDWGKYGDIIFLNLNTSEGVLQFTVYNSHNGYYGHLALIKLVKKNSVSNNIYIIEGKEI